MSLFYANFHYLSYFLPNLVLTLVITLYILFTDYKLNRPHETF